MRKLTALLLTGILLVSIPISTLASPEVVKFSVTLEDSEFYVDMGLSNQSKQGYEYIADIERDTSTLSEYQGILDLDEPGIGGDRRAVFPDQSDKVYDYDNLVSVTVGLNFKINNGTENDTVTIGAFNQEKSSHPQENQLVMTWWNSNASFLSRDKIHSSINPSDDEFRNIYEEYPDFGSYRIYLHSNWTQDTRPGVNETLELESLSLYVRVTTWDVTNIDFVAIDCTELVITNEGQEDTDFDIIMGGSLEMFPQSTFSFNKVPGGEVIREEICVFVSPPNYPSAMYVDYFELNNSIRVSATHHSTQMITISKSVYLEPALSPYMVYEIYSTSVNPGFSDIFKEGQGYLRNQHICSDSSEVNFTVNNGGNMDDTAQIKISNLQELENAGFALSLPANQYLIEAKPEYSDELYLSNKSYRYLGQDFTITVDSSGVEETQVDYLLTVNVSTTLQGVESSDETTIILKLSCQNTEEIDKENTNTNETEEQELESENNTLYEGDEAGECSDEADNDKDGLFDCDDDTCAGSPACKVTDSKDESSLPSVSMIPALISIGLIAIFRRK